MTEFAPLPPPPPRTGRIRRTLGAIAAMVAVVALAVWTLGVWNPWRLTVFAGQLGNPFAGMVVAGALSLLASWLLVPVRNEAAQPGRVRIRIAAALVAVLGLLLWGVGGHWFVAGHRTVLARSATGDRAVVLVERSTDDRELLVSAGSGLAEREVGVLGPACGQVTARFLSRTQVEVDTPYGTFRFPLDPGTGEPIDTMGPHCAVED